MTDSGPYGWGRGIRKGKPKRHKGEHQGKSGCGKTTVIIALALIAVPAFIAVIISHI